MTKESKLEVKVWDDQIAIIREGYPIAERTFTDEKHIPELVGILLNEIEASEKAEAVRKERNKRLTEIAQKALNANRSK